MKTFIFRRVSNFLSKNGDQFASSFHHRIKVGDCLICGGGDDNYLQKQTVIRVFPSCSPSNAINKIDGGKENNNPDDVEENVYFKGKSTKFQRFFVSFVFNKKGTYTFDIFVNDVKTTDDKWVDVLNTRGEHDYKIRVTVNVVE